MSLHRRALIRARQTSKRKNLLGHIEGLESRCLLTTLIGPGLYTYTDPTTQLTTTQVMTQSTVYRTAADDLMQVTVGGNVTAEFVAGVVDDVTGEVTLRNLIGENEPDPANPTQKLKGADLFAVYVQKADINSFIAITRIERDQNSGKINLRPFTDGAGQLRVWSAKNGDNITVDTAANTGKLYLGARTKAIPNMQNSDNIPILSVPTTGPIGVMPWKKGDVLNAGVVVADNQDLGKFLFGGTVTGRVVVGGSMEMFACGQLLTGETDGTYASSVASLSANNFQVKGDLRNLIVAGPIGTNTGADLSDPAYLTRFELKVGGRLGQVRTYDSFTGMVNVLGDEGVSADSQAQKEVETRGYNVDYYTPSFTQGDLTDAVFYNDTLASAQYLASFSSAELGKNDVVQVRGVLAATDKYSDFSDYYAVALDAGQTVETQLVDLATMGMQNLTMTYVSVGVFDPDGRLIATNYANADSASVSGLPFRFTTDRPGLYRFAIGLYGDTIWAGTTTNTTSRMIDRYELRLSNVGKITLGAVAATGNIFDAEYSMSGFTVQNGDLGALVAEGTVLAYSKMLPVSLTARMQMSVEVLNGNLRTIQGAQVGVLRDGRWGVGTNVHVPNGNVGLLRSTAGILVVNDDYIPLDYVPSLDPTVVPVAPLPIVGGDYQMVDAATMLYGNLISNRKIGVVRAGNMATNPASTLMVNADQTGDDGVIDLIDVAGNLGTIESGGPRILTGPKGNVRYMNVGGTVYRDTIFGGGVSPATAYQAGESVTLNDDSGATITISPTGGGGILTVTTYGIRGSGGVAAVRVEATSGVSVNGNPESPLAGAEIGQLRIAAGVAGPGIVQLANGQLAVDPNGPLLAVDLNGKGRVDVFSIVGPRFTRIANNTPGEIVNVLADSIGELRGQTLGVPMHSTEATIQPQAILVGSVAANPGAYPFDLQRVGIIASDILTVNSRGAVGNIIASAAVAADVGTRVYPGYGAGGGTGTIQRLTADSDNTRLKTTFEGIVAPVYASGTLNTVNIGAGIPYGGNGAMALAGLFAGGPIMLVQGNKGADIRGVVASSTRIASIQLTDGSLINADIFVVNPLTDARRIESFKGYPGTNIGGTAASPVYQIGSVVISSSTKSTSSSTGGGGRRTRVDLRGKGGTTTTTPPAPTYLPGGVIGTFFGAYSIGTVKVTGGFGILNSYFHTSSSGIVDRVQAEGYGLRDCVVDAGLRINNLVAVGDGSLIPVTKFSTAVRPSEVAGNDPNAPVPANRTTDLYKFFNIATKTPSVSGKTNSGVISGLEANALRDLGLLQGWRFEGGTPLTGAVGALATTVFSTLNFANSIKTIKIAQDISNVQIVTGAITTFSVGRDVLGLNATVAGTIKTLSVGRDFNSRSKIHAIGPDGSVGSIVIGRNFAGTIDAEHKIGKITVKGRFTGKIRENGKLRTK
ncbi:MAG: hypothetical protein NTU53_07860 [Planctomycetota bacterium]|nr:hypothetical protein [Planctomycetota bacterium]